VLRQSQQTLRKGVVLSPCIAEGAGILGEDGDKLFCRAGAGASRLPKTLGIERVDSTRDVLATGSSNLPVAGLNVPSMLGSGTPSFLACLWNRFCSARFWKRCWRGSLSLIRRVLGPGLGLKVMEMFPVDFRFKVSVGRTGNLGVVLAVLEPSEAVEGALLRADEFGGGRMVGLTCDEDEEAALLRATEDLDAIEACLVTALAVCGGGSLAFPLSTLHVLGSAVVFDAALRARSPVAALDSPRLAPRNENPLKAPSSSPTSPLLSDAAAACLVGGVFAFDAMPLRFGITVLTRF
jgi:hypothetical protein